MQQKFLVILLAAALMAACSRSSIQVSRAVPEELALSFAETLDIRYCDSNDDMLTTLASEAPVRQHTSIAEEAISVDTSAAIEIPADTLANLNKQIEGAYQQEYEQAVASSEQVEFNIPGHMIHMYKIKWNQQVFRSIVSFYINNQACTASYTYALEIPELDSANVMACTA